MRRLSLMSLLAALIILGSGQRAQADFIYQFVTTTSAGIGGSLSATITASDAAVATGTLSAGDITSLSLQLSGTSSPFVDGTTTSTASLSAPFSVDPTTGAFTSGTPELFTAFSPETLTLLSSPTTTATYLVTIPDVGPFQGTGVWSVVPEPSTLLLLCSGVAGLVLFDRRARPEAHNPRT